MTVHMKKEVRKVEGEYLMEGGASVLPKQVK